MRKVILGRILTLQYCTGCHSCQWLGRSLVGTLKAGHCFAVLATSFFISGCLQEKGISGWEENMYHFSGLGTFGNLQQKPAVLWECTVAPWPCQSLHRHTLESVCKQWSCNSFTTQGFPPVQPMCLGSKKRDLWKSENWNDYSHCPNYWKLMASRFTTNVRGAKRD